MALYIGLRSGIFLPFSDTDIAHENKDVEIRLIITI